MALLALMAGCVTEGGRASFSAGSTHVDALLQVGDSLYRHGAPEGARDAWDAALLIARADKDSGAIARALTGLGQAARLLGDHSTSRRLGEQALALKLRLGMPHELFRSYNALGLLAWDQDRLQDAARLLDQAETAARSVHDSVSLAKVASNRALVLQGAGAFEAARNAFVLAGAAAKRVGDTATMSKVANNLAALDIVLGDPVSAVSGLDAARLLARAVGDSATELNARGQLALAYDALGEPQRAFAILDSAVNMAGRTGRRVEEAENRKILADLFAEAGDHRHALEQYRGTRALIDSLALPDIYANILRNEARSLEALGNLPQARARARSALAMHRRNALRWQELADLVFLTGLEGRAGDRGVAESRLGEAAGLAAALAVPAARTRVALAEAQLAALASDWRRVLAALDRIRSPEDFATIGDEAEASRLRARALGASGRLEESVREGRRTIAVIERVRAGYATGELRTTYLAEKASVYAEQVLRLLRLARHEEAFQVADAARGRALLEHLVAARHDIGASAESQLLLERERLLRRIEGLVARLESRRNIPPQERASSFAASNADLADTLRAARSEYEAIVARAERGTRVASTLIGAPQVDTKVLVQSLGTDEAVLEYLVTPERVLIFVVTSGGLATHAVDVALETLAARVRLVRQLLQDPVRAPSAVPALRSLHRDLIASVAATGVLRGVRRLVIVPHAFLTYLPFAALLDAASGRYLVEDFVLTHAATASSIVALRTRGRENASREGAPPPGVVPFAPFPEALPASLVEASTIASVSGGSPARVGKAATEGAVRTALASRQMVHLATHARMNPGNPLFSRIELYDASSTSSADNGRLEVHELLALRVSSPLVFLSGCETALGGRWATHFDAGEDYTTLSQALLYSGAGAVVATLWRIDDRGSARLAQHFYRSGQRSYAESLAFAQRAMLGTPEFSNPYYWAAHQVSGGGGG